MNKSHKIIVLYFLCVICNCTFFALNNANAETSGSESSEISIMDYMYAGDGQTPTFLQYLDTQKFEMAKTSDLATATDKGDITYALPMELPPALLKPTVTLNYSSEGTMDMEMPYGWSLGGIVEIRRPLSRSLSEKSFCNSGCVRQFSKDQ